jgi:hypothetical protein
LDGNYGRLAFVKKQERTQGFTESAHQNPLKKRTNMKKTISYEVLCCHTLTASFNTLDEAQRFIKEQPNKHFYTIVKVTRETQSTNNL